MRISHLRTLVLLLGVWIFSGCWSLVFGASLEITITPRFSGTLIQPNSLCYETSAKDTFSITRVSYLLSGFALQRTDGSWLELTNQVAWFDLERRRASVTLRDVPFGDYRGVCFDVGLDSAVNHADPARFAADHPLNPNLNGLHWSWQGGYIFLALEGRWRDAAGRLDGWSYHLANDSNRTRILLAASLSLADDTKLELNFDVATLLNAPRTLSFGRDGSSTHSRPGDPIAAALVANLPGAFQVTRVLPWMTKEDGGSRVAPLYLPKVATPHRFKMGVSFPVPDLPRDNPLIEERVALGKLLFHETALSRDNTVSCASCHDASRAFADPRQFSVGVDGRSGTRNAMPLFNLAWKESFFWDGRAASLREQTLMPIQDHAEMDESLTNVLAKLRAEPEYVAAFAAAFEPPEITPEKIGLAIECFMLVLTSFDSKFDRALKGDEELNQDEKRGFELFMTEYDPRRQQFGADCFHCHGGPLFQSQTFANNGLDAGSIDRGRANVTGLDSDAGKFATPSLRNIALTSPYMHDGRFVTLEEVVAHYSSGMRRSPTLDPNLAKHPDGGVPLSDADKKALVAFLRTLTDKQFLRSVQD